MSASQKLKALDKNLAAPPWRQNPARPAMVQVWRTSQERYSFRTTFETEPPYLAALRNALPQLVAVVEAAESFTSFDPSAWHGSRIVAALAALDEALGAGEVE